MKEEEKKWKMICAVKEKDGIRTKEIKGFEGGGKEGKANEEKKGRKVVEKRRLKC